MLRQTFCVRVIPTSKPTKHNELRVKLRAYYMIITAFDELLGGCFRPLVVEGGDFDYLYEGSFVWGLGEEAPDFDQYLI